MRENLHRNERDHASKENHEEGNRHARRGASAGRGPDEQARARPRRGGASVCRRGFRRGVDAGYRVGGRRRLAADRVSLRDEDGAVSCVVRAPQNRAGRAAGDAARAGGRGGRSARAHRACVRAARHADQGTDAGLAYAKLVAREASDPREAERGIVAEYFDPFAAEFVGAIKKELPGHGASYAHWAYLFAVGALVMSAFDSRIERISNGKVKAGALKSKTTHLVTFITAGIRAGATPV
uniref:PsrA tetracyclin repressor-like C-terminal domain-containing protein n=1 Tax=Burkholderia orbicola (strain AU 1054) TaxID=331271 RepID=A0A0H2Y1X4_BURO1